MIAARELIQNALVGAVFGAIATYFIPFMSLQYGAFLGALIAAATGFFKSLGQKSSSVTIDPATPTANPFVADEIAKLDGLRKSGAITEQEFQQQKAKLLAR